MLQTCGRQNRSSGWHLFSEKNSGNFCWKQTHAFAEVQRHYSYVRYSAAMIFHLQCISLLRQSFSKVSSVWGELFSFKQCLFFFLEGGEEWGLLTCLFCLDCSGSNIGTLKTASCRRMSFGEKGSKQDKLYLLLSFTN